ncbi:MarR family winged helix-turn-helix transcriptional regulator [Pseudonocardia benzenivorans]|uniref:MarR family winged helix-turn-helix transcriptional regulator n=1 Tax=Pseudonocardia benzenivorans TaxID=228005 RepID=A0ABW3VD08_9PSEU|nr:MarR family winged helix-turn-helix transcriptional regulator [Pseudonocardia dioxanivorans]
MAGGVDGVTGGGTGAGTRPDAALRELLGAMDGRCNSFAARRAARYLSASYDRALAPAGLRTTQFTILHKLAVAGRASISGLADTIAMDRTTLATNLKPLERDGLLTVRPDEHDRRTRLVEITEAGLRTLEHALPLWQEAQDTFEAAFGASEAANLRTALRAVLDTDLDPWAE